MNFRRALHLCHETKEIIKTTANATRKQNWRDKPKLKTAMKYHHPDDDETETIKNNLFTFLKNTIIYCI